MNPVNINIGKPRFNPATTSIDTTIELPVVRVGVESQSTLVGGLQGAVGLQGCTGLQGIQGPEGKGHTGPQGSRGLPGTGLDIKGYVTTPDLLRTANLGDAWLVGSNIFVQVGFNHGDEGTWNKSWKDLGKLTAPTQGAQGTKGEDGLQGTQGLKGADGVIGMSAYQLAVSTGYEGSLESYLMSLHGPKGAMGDQGLQGSQGLTGSQGTTGKVGNPFSIKKIFRSVQEMESGLNTSGVESGEFVLIDSRNVGDLDNGKIYCKSELGWNFIYNLSNIYKVEGPQGLQGSTGPIGLQGSRGLQGVKGESGNPYKFPIFANKSKAEEWILSNMDVDAIPGTLVSIVGDGDSEGGTVELYAINANYNLVKPKI